MNLFEAIDHIRQKLIEYQVGNNGNLWSTILKEIEDHDSFNGNHADVILKMIRSFVSQLDDRTAIALWRSTEAGQADDTEDDQLFPDSIRMDLDMELLSEITEAAWYEANEKDE